MAASVVNDGCNVGSGTLDMLPSEPAAGRRTVNLKALRKAKNPRVGRRAKAQIRKAIREAENQIKIEAQLDPNHARSEAFVMNPSFPQTGTPGSWKRGFHWTQNHNNVNRYGHPQPSGSLVIPPYTWDPQPYTPSPPRPPPLLSNGRGRKRSSEDDGSYDQKRQRLDSPGPASSLTPPPRPVPPGCSPHSRQTNPSLWGSSPAASRLLQPYAEDELSSQIVELFEACHQKTSDLERKELCRTQLQKEVQKVFPAARIFLAGSSLNGFGSTKSDADLCMVLPRAPNQWKDTIHVLTEVYMVFRQLAYLRNVQLIKAKVPILKARDCVSGVEFDLNVNNTVGIRNTFLLRSYAYLEPRVRPLIMVVKKWAQFYDINDASKGTLSSYTLVLLVLHYLQTLQKPVIPSLQKQYPECFSLSMDIHMVPEGPRHIPPYASSNHSSLGDLLLGFLKYYTCSFSWDQKVASVREGKALPRSTNKEWQNKFICVEEPFEKRNTARAVYEKAKFDIIKYRFTESWRALQQKKDLNAILPGLTLPKPAPGPNPGPRTGTEPNPGQGLG